MKDMPPFAAVAVQLEAQRQAAIKAMQVKIAADIFSRMIAENSDIQVSPVLIARCMTAGRMFAEQAHEVKAR